MRRQALLAGLFVVLVVGAGCTAGGPSDRSPTSTVSPDTPTATESTEDRNPTTTGSPGDRNIPRSDTAPFRNFSIGAPGELPENVGAHTYLILNNQTTARTIELQVLRDGQAELNRTVEFPPGDDVRIEVFWPGNYTLKIDPSNAPEQAIDAPDTFDCNYRIVEAAVLPGGNVIHALIQSVVRCGTLTTTA
jgi:hypothetical protein